MDYTKPGMATPHETYLHRAPFSLLFLPLVLLAAVTGYVLFIASDPSVQALFTSCVGSSIPSSKHPIADLPVLGVPLCCLVTFFHAALNSWRSTVIMGEILAYVGAILTITTLESARASSHANRIIRYPTISWLVFNLAGGAVVWQLVIVPAFLSYHRAMHDELSMAGTGSNTMRPTGTGVPAGDGGGNGGHAANETAVLTQHATLKQSHYMASGSIGMQELHAIPIAVTCGYIAPCLWFTLRPSALSIGVWLFFPIYVSFVRQITRRWTPGHLRALYQRNTTLTSTIHPETSDVAAALLYVPPIICSVVTHALLIYHLVMIPDDRSATTRAALGFIQLDFSAIGLTILYMIFHVMGARAALRSLGVGILFGPGAGLCLIWMLENRRNAIGAQNIKKTDE